MKIDTQNFCLNKENQLNKIIFSFVFYFLTDNDKVGPYSYCVTSVKGWKGLLLEGGRYPLQPPFQPSLYNCDTDLISPEHCFTKLNFIRKNYFFGRLSYLSVHFNFRFHCFDFACSGK